MSMGAADGPVGRLTDLVSLGALTSLVPRDVLDEAIEAHGCREERVRKLPSHLVIYLLIALCLFPDDDYEEVAEKLTGMLNAVPGARWQAPSRGAITQARQRLGPEVLREVFTHLARLMAIDGFVLDLPDTAANVAEFGRDHSGDATVYPQARIVAISECAAHAPVAADVAGCWAGEQTVAYSLYEHLAPDMLLTADRGFYSFYAWEQARRSGAQLLWRVQATLRLDHLRDLPDGSWLAVATRPGQRQSHKQRQRAAARAGTDPGEDAVVVRVVQYTVPDRGGEEIRLITSILDPADASAEQLARTYHERWGATRGRTSLSELPEGGRQLLSTG
ncbi:IS4 family transposase [Streptomyces mirabilis]|uniref:IS4 family transposase n=1 Tax=Streptomyces mirabilis TaxID=68239 RepID=UPI0034090553